MPDITDLSSWLHDRRARVDADLRQWAAAESRWAWGRLVAFLVLVGAWYPLREMPWLAGAVAGGGLIFFVFAIQWHRRASGRHAWLRLEALVLGEAQSRLGGNVVAVRFTERPVDGVGRRHVEGRHEGTEARRHEGGGRDEGTDVIPAQAGTPGHEGGEGAQDSALGTQASALPPDGPTWALSEQERDDLDLYSRPVGLFGLINRTSSPMGAQRLRDMLENLCLDPERITARQESARWLAEHHAERTTLLGALAGLRGLDEALEAYHAAVDDARPIFSALSRWALRAWTIVNIAFVGFVTSTVLRGNTDYVALFILVIMVNLVVLAFTRGRARRMLEKWEEAMRFGEPVLELAGLAQQNLPERTGLRLVRDQLEAVGRRRALPGVLSWVGWSSSGGIISGLLNALVFYDLHMLDGILRHVLPHQRELLRVISAIGELEALLSLACFAAEQPGVTWPALTDEMVFDIRQGMHPLIEPAAGVPNDLQLRGGAGLWVITGSNMSGKSTFLRMAGVNALLAHCGGPAVAAGMRFRPLRLITDLRVRDNLAKGESFFLAEVRQLRRMITPPAGDAPVLGLADEPFRGTNHQEQRGATLAIIEHLASSPGLFLVATHDRTVARQVEGNGVRNHHFQEELGERELMFDYRIRPGVAETRNALRVLEREGYPASLTKRAHGVVDEEGEEE